MRKHSLIATVLLCASITFLPLICHAQGGPPPPGGPPMGMGGPGGPHFGPPGGPGGPRRGGGGMGRLVRALNLTPAQVAKIKPIMDASRPKMVAIFQDPKLTMDQKFAKLKRIRDWEFAKIKPFLTPSQAAKLKALAAQQQRFGPPGGPGGPGGPWGNRGLGGPGHPGGPMGGMGGPGGPPH